MKVLHRTCLLVFASLFSMVSFSQNEKPTLSSQSDSISYAIGLLQSQYLVNPNTPMGKEQADMFLKGIMEAQAATESDSLKKAYYTGLFHGLNFVAENFEMINKNLFQEESDRYLNKEIFFAGMKDGIMKEVPQMGVDTLQNYLNSTMEKVQADINKKKYADNIEASTKFFAQNKKKKGVKTLPNGLQYKVLTAGKGEIPKSEDEVVVNYKGTLIDGTEFDSSYSRNEPFTTNLNNVIKGWTEVLQLMPVGSKWEVYIPSDLAYGDRETGIIQPYSALIFEIELLEIKKNTEE
ncbi:MAG: FKBP-type peptidyl-prolyl cis-trans isomerase [Candidatus Azobacteroides sp.]|nr:FKBP-type peptidyl-prolyl cis-trans isomerase [Candidatus Azobacteroides sp.]